MKSSLNNTLFFPSNNEKQTENFKQVEGELRQQGMRTSPIKFSVNVVSVIIIKLNYSRQKFGTFLIDSLKLHSDIYQAQEPIKGVVI